MPRSRSVGPTPSRRTEHRTEHRTEQNSPRIIQVEEEFVRRSTAPTSTFFTRDGDDSRGPRGYRNSGATDSYYFPPWAPGFDLRRSYYDDPNYDASPPITRRLMDEFGDGIGGRGRGLAAGSGAGGGKGGSSMSGDREKEKIPSTCRLTLVVYRLGSRGVVVRHVKTAHPKRFSSQSSFRHALRKDPDLVYTDSELFREIRRIYQNEMCGFWRMYCSLKSLQTFRLLSFGGDCRLRPVVVPLGESTMQEVMYAYRFPEELETRDAWVDWVYRLRRPDRKHALEFVEGWDGVRILIAGSLAIMAPVVVVVVWTPLGGSPDVTFLVAGFILALSTAVIGLLAILSHVMPSH